MKTKIATALAVSSSMFGTTKAQTLNTQGISMHYEVYGTPANPPVLLISGLGGMGVSWGPQIKKFAEKYYVILPDQRGTGQTTRAKDGYTTQQLAADMASLVEHLALGPVHVVGSSTGGAIAQYMTLNHPNTVRSLTISSSFARFDAFVKREFEVRRKMIVEWDKHTVLSANALFLFSSTYTREHPEKVTAWIERASAHPEKPEDKEISLKRIDMVAAHDAFSRLGEIKKPTLVICGDHNLCTTLALSQEIANAIPNAKLSVLKDAGELIELEKEQEYFDIVSTFIDSK
ncbi:MAG: alpha/beta fold hydrolase [Bacteroidia bacterium]